jgi:hypothetical protein
MNEVNIGQTYDIVDCTKYNGQTGRMLYVLGIVKGKSSSLCRLYLITRRN